MRHCMILASVACAALMSRGTSATGHSFVLDLSDDIQPSPNSIQSTYAGPGPYVYAHLVVTGSEPVKAVAAGIQLEGVGVTPVGGFVYLPPWTPSDTTVAGFGTVSSSEIPCPADVGYWTLQLDEGSSSQATVTIVAPGGPAGELPILLDPARRAVCPDSLFHGAINSDPPQYSVLPTAHAFRDSANCKVIFMSRDRQIHLPAACTGAPLAIVDSIAPALSEILGAYGPTQIEKCIPEASAADSILTNSIGKQLRRPHLWDAYRAIATTPQFAESLLLRLQGCPSVLFAHPCYVATATTNDPDYPQQWHLNNVGQGGGAFDADIDAPEAWAKSEGSPAVRVCIIDNGVYKQHPDLVGRPIGGDDGYVEENNDRTQVGHGTVTAGVAFATANNGIHLAPVDWHATVLEGLSRYFHCDGLAENIYRAREWNSDIISMSWFCNDLPGDPLLIKYALADVYRSGVGLVASSGNDYSSVTRYPAAWPFVIAVSGTDKNDDVYDGSTYGDWVDLSAPGEEVLSTCMPGNIDSECKSAIEVRTYSGTSLAAPIVAATASLVKAANEQLDLDDVRVILERTADDLPPAGCDPHFGHGRVNAVNAVELATTYDFFHSVSGVSIYSTEDLGIVPTYCDQLAWYNVRRYELHGGFGWIGDGHFVDAWVENSATFGSSGDPTYGCWYPWGEVTSLEPEQYTVRTFVYEWRDMDDHFVAWVPCSPENACVGVTLLRPRSISGTSWPGARAAVATWEISGASPGSGPFAVVLRGGSGVPRDGAVDIFDAAGRLTRHLWSGRLRDETTAVWDCRDDDGERVRSGVYFVRASGLAMPRGHRKIVVVR